MSSKLEKFSELILAALAEGRSYQFVADELLRVGVEITPQSVWEWNKRRQARIAKRRAQETGAATAATLARGSATPLPLVRSHISAKPADSSGPLRALRAHIDEQTRQHETNPWTPLINQFPVRR